jgi:diguanylate cyclase (GGDEF)-like protein
VRRFCRDRYASGFALGVLALGMAATVAVYSVCASLVYREAMLRFDNESRSVEQQISMRVRLYSDVLVTMRALFSTDDEVTRDEFRDFVQGLDLPGRYPGFQTLNYASYVHAADIDAFVAKQRRDRDLMHAGIQFSIRPLAPYGDHNVLTYLEPFEANLASLGADMDADPQRRLAMQTLRDTGEPMSSGRRVFADRGAQQVGLAMRMPVYRRGMPTTTVEERRRAYLGSVGAGMRVNDMMAGLLSAETLREIKFTIYDAGNMRLPAVSPSAATLLFDSVGGAAVSAPKRAAASASGGRAVEVSHAPAAIVAPEPAADKLLQRRAEQSFAGRRWLIVIAADRAALAGSQRFLPVVALASGTVISVLLAGLAYALSSSRARAIKLAHAITFDLRESEAARAEAQRIAHLGDWRVNLDDGTMHLSKEMARLIGWRHGMPTIKRLACVIDKADRRALYTKIGTTLNTRDSFEFECRYRSMRGRRGWLRVIGQAYGVAGTCTLRGTALEITKQKSVERVRELEHAFTLQLATAANEFDIVQQLVASLVNGMDWEAGAFWPTQAGHKQLLCAVHAAPVRELEPWLLARAHASSIEENVPAEPRWCVGRNGVVSIGEVRWLAEADIVTTFAFPVRIGPVVLGVAEFYSRERRHAEPQALDMARSITSQMSHFLQRRQAEDNLHFLANHDVLTGLPNRLMFKEHLEDAVIRAEAENTSLHVLFIDLDRFKDINDSLGHNIGDQLLRAVAERLNDEVASADMIARLGGDEFIVLVKECNARGSNVLHTIDSIQASLAKPFFVGGMQLQVSASIGVSAFPGDGNDAQTLLKHADIAMYGAKQRGKNTYQMYLRQMSMSLQRRVEMEAQLRHAVENNEFTLVYQPRVNLRTNTCTGVEALIRWHNPTLGLVMPGDFIPLAEETGAIVPIGAWVLREACLQAAKWLELGLGPIHVAVNLSARQFADPHLHESILDALDEAHLPGDLLELELTESMVMRHPEQAVRWLTSLKKTGVRLSIDDFGTGYSSLAYLNRFPIDLVKIDRSFIRNVPDSHSDTQITSAVIALGHSLGLTVIAEGAETQAQIDFLRKEGCDEVQGFFYSRPISAADVRSFLDRPAEAGPSSPKSSTRSARGIGLRRSYHP